MNVTKSIAIRREHPGARNASELIAELDAYLDPLYPKESQHGYSVDKLVEQRVEFFVIYCDGEPAACGGVQIICDQQDSVERYGELKRMYVRGQYRGLGLAKLLLEHLERLALDRGATVMRLETGIHQPEAVGLYERCGYHRIPPFGGYPPDDPLSLCYEKRLGVTSAIMGDIDNVALPLGSQQSPMESA